MQYIHDQTIRLMAHGLTPDELVEAIPALPPRLRDHPWLGEYYGTVAQTVRQIYVNTFGWFEGDPTTLDPLPRRERSARYVAAMGGRDALIATATRARDEGDDRWVAEILTHLLRVDPDDRDARQLKADALRRLGFQAINPIWRNTYLTAARELDRMLDRASLLATMRSLANPDVATTMPIPLLLRAFTTRLNPAQSMGTACTVSLHCADTATGYALTIRSEIAELLPQAPTNPTVVIETSEATLRGLLTGRIPWSRAIDDKAAAVTRGNAAEAERFWSLFDPPLTELPAIALR
jgi:alkyl sulfatase BDS1-like metallo-beta-lactamase superfamily hydrolase